MCLRLFALTPYIAGLFLLLVLPQPAAHSSVFGPADRPTRRSQEAPRDRARWKCRVCNVADRLGLAMTPIRKPRLMRCCHPTGPMRLRWPRGRTLPEELAQVHIDVSADIFDLVGDAESLALEIRREGRVLATGSTPVPDNVEQWVDADLLRAHRGGLHGIRGELTLGIYAQDRRGVESRFYVDAPEPRVRRRVRHARFLTQGEPLWVRDVLLAQTYFNAEYDGAAERLARRVLHRSPNEPHAYAITAAIYKLTRMDESCEAQHVHSNMWESYQKRQHAEDRCTIDDTQRSVLGARKRYAVPSGGCGSEDVLAMRPMLSGE